VGVRERESMKSRGRPGRITESSSMSKVVFHKMRPSPVQCSKFHIQTPTKSTKREKQPI